MLSIKALRKFFMSMGGGFQMSQAAFVSYRTAKQFFPQNKREVADIFMMRLRDEGDVDYTEKKIIDMYDNKYDLQTLTLNKILNEFSDTMEKSLAIFNMIIYMAILSATAGVLRMIATLNPGLTLNFLISFERILLALGLAMFSSFLGVLYPSIRALKVKPVEALRYRG